MNAVTGDAALTRPTSLPELAAILDAHDCIAIYGSVARGDVDGGAGSAEMLEILSELSDS